MATMEEKVLLSELSEDARATVTHMAKKVGRSRVTLVRLMDRVVKRFDVRFTIEINMDKLGMSERYIVAVKFRQRPTDAELRELFKDDRNAQCVYLMNGTFDLLIYAVADSAVNYIRWETHLAESLSQYGPTIMPSRYIYSHFGYFPMSDSFTDFIGTENRLDDADRQILRLMNSDSRLSYKEMGSRLGLSDATVRYRLFKLVKSGIIARFTIAAQAPGEGYSSVAYLINYTFTKTTSSVAFARAMSCYINDDKDAPAFNTFQLVFPISGSFRSFGMVLCEDRKTALEKAVRRHRAIFKNENIRILYGELVAPIKGILPFRRLDISANYKSVSWRGSAV